MRQTRPASTGEVTDASFTRLHERKAAALARARTLAYGAQRVARPNLDRAFDSFSIKRAAPERRTASRIERS